MNRTRKLSITDKALKQVVKAYMDAAYDPPKTYECLKVRRNGHEIGHSARRKAV